MLSFSEALHEEVKANGVTVTSLCPGPTATEFGAVAGSRDNAMIDKLSARPEDVVRAGIKAMEKRHAIVIPGLINKASAQVHRLLPRWLLRKITGSIKLQE